MPDDIDKQEDNALIAEIERLRDVVSGDEAEPEQQSPRDNELSFQEQFVNTPGFQFFIDSGNEANPQKLESIIQSLQQEIVNLQTERQLNEENAFDQLKRYGALFQEKRELNKQLIQLREELLKKGDQGNKHHVEVTNVLLRKLIDEVQRSQNDTQMALRKIYPPSITQELYAGQYGFRRFDVSILIAQIKDFKNYIKGRVPEDIASELREFSTTLNEVVTYHSGWLLHSIGGKIIAIFGVPVSTRSHAVEATLAALRIREAVTKLPFQLHIIITSGQALAGDFGSPHRPNFSCLGDPLAEADEISEKEAYADYGIIISEDAFKFVNHVFSTTSLGHEFLESTGKRSLFYTVLGLRKVRENPDRISPHSILAQKYGDVEDEVIRYRDLKFPHIDFLKVESRDGAVSHSVATAYYAVALMRHLKLQCPEDKIIRAAFLHEIGKLLIDKTLLTKTKPTSEELNALKKIPAYSIAMLTKVGQHTDIIPLIEEMHGLRQPVSAAAKLLKIANTYDALTCPKLYKIKLITRSQACRTLLEIIPDDMTKTFIDIIN